MSMRLLSFLKRLLGFLSSLERPLGVLGVAIGGLALIVEVALFALGMGSQKTESTELLFIVSGGVFGLANIVVWFSLATKPELQKNAQSPAPQDEILVRRSSSAENIGPTQPRSAWLGRMITGKARPGPPDDLPTQLLAKTSSYAYTVPKETLYSQDKFGSLIDQERCRFAMADGVSASFLPSKWAEIIVEEFLNLPEDFNVPQKFAEWLVVCSTKWSEWADTVWIPEMQQRRNGSYDWSSDRQRGAETTLIGCSFSPVALTQAGYTNVLVTAVGDAVFFLVHPPSAPEQEWKYIAYALTDPTEFNSTPSTLLSVEANPYEAWRQVQRKILRAERGDYILLATDALAKWILFQTKHGNSPWPLLLSLRTKEAFEIFVEQERKRRALDLDDTTLMVIGLA